MAVTIDKTRQDKTRQASFCARIFYSRKLREAVRTPLQKLGIFKIVLLLRVYFRRFLWNAEYIFFRIIRRKRIICILQKEGWENIGLFAYFNRFLSGISYADRKNMLPVVDMKSIMNAYMNEDDVGRVNSWEYYFEQPAGISVDEALKLENHIIVNCSSFPAPYQHAELFYNKAGELDYWRKICKKYIRPSSEVKARLESLKAKYNGKKILGVLIRGTAYVAWKPHDHPIPPTAEQAIEKVKQVMNEGKFDAVYLATEDIKILRKFQAEFGDKLIEPYSSTYDFYFDDASQKWITEYADKKEHNDKYLNGLEYCVSMLFLSSCNGFIASMTSGSTAVICLSEGFEYIYVFDLGMYP